MTVFLAVLCATAFAEPVALDGAVDLGVSFDMIGAGGDLQQLAVTARGGWFVTENLEIGLAISGARLPGIRTGAVGPDVGWYFGGEWVRPYVAVGFGPAFLDMDQAANDARGVFAGLAGGLLVPLNPRVALDWNLGMSGTLWNNGPDTARLGTSGLGIRWLVGAKTE